MFFFIIGEPNYSVSSWYNLILNGILNEKRSKRFNTVIIDSVEEIYNFRQNCDDVIIVIGSSLSWLEPIIDASEKIFGKNIIVLGNFERRLHNRQYSIVASDIAKDVTNIYTYLTSYRKERIAMYGTNPNSASDDYRIKVFSECGGKTEDIYINNANLKECFDTFFPNISKYDAVLCANDYCAVSLINHLKSNNTSLPFIASCGDTMLARVFSPTVTNLKTNYADFGKAAVNVYKMLQKDIKISSLKVSLVSTIVPGDTTNNLLPKSHTEAPKKCSNRSFVNDCFYSDTEVAEMLRIEKVLNACDNFDYDFLCCLINGMTYSEIAEKFNISVNGAKYKLKKLFEICCVSSKSEFLQLVNKYIRLK